MVTAGSYRDHWDNDMNRRLVLNLSPIQFDDAEVRVGILEYQSKEHLQALRATHFATHVFRRVGKRLLCVPVAPEAPVIGDTFETIHLAEDLYLCAALIRDALLNHLHKLGRKILDYDPIKFIADGSGEDLLAASIPPRVSCPIGLSVRPFYEISTRVIRPDRQPAFVGLAVNVRTTRLIINSCDELLASDFPLAGHYVGRLVDRDDARLAPRFELLGRVKAIDNQRLLLDDARPGLSDIDAKAAVLEPRADYFALCLAHVFKEHAPRVKQSLDIHLEELRSGPGRLNKLRKVISYLAKLHLEMVPGVAFRLLPFLMEGKTQAFPRVHEAPKPVYIFDPTGTRTSRWHDQGLDDHGPYDAQTFTPSRPRICIICQRNRKGQVEQFLHKFFNGIVERQGRTPFAKGFVRKYRLEDFSVEFFLSDGHTAEAYQRAARQALEYQTQQNIKWDLVLVQIEECFHALYGGSNPYLVTKAAFLAQQIPVQEFEIETTAVSERQLAYVLNNMALATYAKLGGVPWLIKANPTIAHEFVVGLGSAYIGDGRLGGRERVVGITTVFSGDGYYWLSNLSKAVPIAEYKGALLTSLRTTIESVRRDLNWQPREHIRLVFHSFKPLKDAEAEAVIAVMAELGDYDVEFAFLHVVDDHPYMLFDEHQRGIRHVETYARKGILAPKRGLFFRLSDEEVLFSLIGPNELKCPRMACPIPFSYDCIEPLPSEIPPTLLGRSSRFPVTHGEASSHLQCQ
jgi:Piwi domain